MTCLILHLILGINVKDVEGVHGQLRRREDRKNGEIGRREVNRVLHTQHQFLHGMALRKGKVDRLGRELFMPLLLALFGVCSMGDRGLVVPQYGVYAYPAAYVLV